MGQIKGKLRLVRDGYVAFWCPGCKEAHLVNVGKGSPGAHWSFDGNYDAPTFAPSVDVRSGHYARWHKSDEECWCTYNAKHPEDANFHCQHCHTFVRGGMIQFLDDCSHALAGQTVPMPDYPVHL